ncbi:MAG: hypothetical protein ACE5ES_06290, partial [Candidatus Nanoarchaeia archaeon]
LCGRGMEEFLRLKINRMYRAMKKKDICDFDKQLELYDKIKDLAKILGINTEVYDKKVDDLIERIERFQHKT